MIAWLKGTLNSTNPESSGGAAWALTAFVEREPSLRQPLISYAKTAPYFYKYIVLREMSAADSSLREQYIDVLLSGLGSQVPTDRTNATYGLEMFCDPTDLRARLESRVKESVDATELSLIAEALDLISNVDR